MAGSYEHLFGGWRMIENMGDAAECVHELWWLVERAIGREKALELLRDEYYPMVRDERPRDKHFEMVDEHMSREDWEYEDDE